MKETLWDMPRLTVSHWTSVEFFHTLQSPPSMVASCVIIAEMIKTRTQDCHQHNTANYTSHVFQNLPVRCALGFLRYSSTNFVICVHLYNHNRYVDRDRSTRTWLYVEIELLKWKWSYNEVIWVGMLLYTLCPYKKKGWGPSFTRGQSREDTGRGQCLKARQQASEEAKPAHFLTSDLWPSGQWHN